MSEVLAALVGALAGFGGAVVVEFIRESRQHRADLAILDAELEALERVIDALIAAVGKADQSPWGRKFEGHGLVEQLHAFLRSGTLVDRRWLHAIEDREARRTILGFYTGAVETHDRLDQHAAIPSWSYLTEENKQAEFRDLLEKLAAVKESCANSLEAVRVAETALPTM
jgi:hypothetical protein